MWPIHSELRKKNPWELWEIYLLDKSYLEDSEEPQEASPRCR